MKKSTLSSFPKRPENRTVLEGISVEIPTSFFPLIITPVFFHTSIDHADFSQEANWIIFRVNRFSGQITFRST